MAEQIYHIKRAMEKVKKDNEKKDNEIKSNEKKNTNNTVIPKNNLR
jgi:hypothetical protein